MKNYIFILLTLVLAACGTDNQHFKIEGRLLNLNQGEFYVYSTDGVIDKIDTIKVNAGRFTYNTQCKKPGTLIIVFPNFSQQPVFAEPGKSVEFKGDASHLKELSVKGTNENKLMNSFREHVATMSPPETKKFAETFITDHPASLVAVYLLSNYFIQSANPDYATAARLAKVIAQAQPDNISIKQLSNQLLVISKTTDKARIPKFTAKDINGKTITEKDYSKGDAVICVWATWEYESASMHRMLRSIEKERTDRALNILSVSIDADAKECKRCIERDEITWSVVCDEKMMEGNLINTFAVASIPECIVLRDGKIIKRVYTISELRQTLK